MKTRIIFISIAVFLFLMTACSPETSQPSGMSEETNAEGIEAEETALPDRDSDLLNIEGSYEDEFPGDVVETYVLITKGKPKYPEDFKHFDYVNPDAPKKGILRSHSIGSYDSFNRYAQRGDMVVGSDSIYDTLMVSSQDEPGTYYPLIAEKVIYTKDFREITFILNENARFHDGEPITADDVVFTYNQFMEEGVATFKAYYEPLVESFEALDERSVKITLFEGNKETLFDFAAFTVMPEHIWTDLDLAEPLDTPPVGSGAYIVGNYEMGKFIEWELFENYWAKDLPVNVGINNFKVQRFDYYKDENVAFEAFKAGEFDIYSESISKNWNTMYNGTNFDMGYIIKEEIPHEIPLGMSGFTFNTDIEIFKNRNVREAIAYALDFEWMNENLFYGQYERTRSYFQNSPYEALGIPQGRELEILEEIRDQLPARLFEEEFRLSETDGSGNIRPQIREALQLFETAGWVLRDQKLVNSETGEPFSFEIIFYSPSYERVIKPLQENLAKMGIDVTLSMLDPTQYQNRVWDKDYEMIIGRVGGTHHPDSNYSLYWHSKYADETYNTATVRNPAVDYLLEGIEANQENIAELRYWGRALDRVLTWEYYQIPWWRLSKFRIAYWNKFSSPELRPKYALGTDTWWLDDEKTAALPEKYR